MAKVQYCKGDIFEAKTQVIVNTVNCKGVMGKGLALSFKQKFPDMFPVYQEECRTGKLRIGRPTLYQQSTPWILNFPTKNDWKANSKIEYLQAGLEYFVKNYKKAGITSIAFPKLGAQNGKLSWDDVGPLMVSYLQQVDIDIYIYIAEGDKEYYPDSLSLEQRMEARWKQFNEIALHMECLRQDLKINKTDAKKIAARREKVEFKSLSDIENIGKLAETSLTKISKFFKEEFIASPLPGLSVDEASDMSKNTPPKRNPRRKRKKQVDIETTSLFQEVAP